MSWTPLGPALLFCPADRPDRFAKAASAADMVILDLEDGVNASDRVAREARSQGNAARPPANDRARQSRRLRRTSPSTSSPRPDALYLGHARQDRIGRRTSTRSPGAASSLCARPRKGVLESPSIAAAASTVALMWGAEDLVGVSRRDARVADDDGTYRDFARFARSQVLLSARAHDRVAIDAIHLDIADLEGLREEAQDAASSGFWRDGLHPSVASRRDP